MAAMMQRQRWILLHPVFALFVFAVIIDAPLLGDPAANWVFLVIGAVVVAPSIVWLVHYWHRRQLKRHPGPPPQISN